MTTTVPFEHDRVLVLIAGLVNQDVDALFFSLEREDKRGFFVHLDGCPGCQSMMDSVMSEQGAQAGTAFAIKFGMAFMGAIVNPSDDSDTVETIDAQVAKQLAEEERISGVVAKFIADNPGLEPSAFGIDTERYPLHALYLSACELGRWVRAFAVQDLRNHEAVLTLRQDGALFHAGHRVGDDSVTVEEIATGSLCDAYIPPVGEGLPDDRLAHVETARKVINWITAGLARNPDLLTYYVAEGCAVFEPREAQLKRRPLNEEKKDKHLDFWTR